MYPTLPQFIKSENVSIAFLSSSENTKRCKVNSGTHVNVDKHMVVVIIIVSMITVCLYFAIRCSGGGGKSRKCIDCGMESCGAARRGTAACCSVSIPRTGWVSARLYCLVTWQLASRTMLSATGALARCVNYLWNIQWLDFFATSFHFVYILKNNCTRNQ